MYFIFLFFLIIGASFKRGYLSWEDGMHGGGVLI